ncbi:hypothetical protein NQZ70_02065 [Sorangium sp. Soce836]|nr:hypothetical protein NQZ70_02065 [Sorangium sp. Soce836]
MLTFRTGGADYKLSAGELSDGQRTLVVLYGFLLGAIEHAMLALLDEPETGLAPHEMQPCSLTEARREVRRLGV